MKKGKEGECSAPVRAAAWRNTKNALQKFNQISCLPLPPIIHQCSKIKINRRGRHQRLKICTLLVFCCNALVKYSRRLAHRAISKSDDSPVEQENTKSSQNVTFFLLAKCNGVHWLTTRCYDLLLQTRVNLSSRLPVVCLEFLHVTRKRY